jgi:hypothetical protein
MVTSPLRLTTSIFFLVQLNIWDHSPYVTSSLTRGWVCHLQLLLVLASTVILRSESRGTHDHILLSHFRNPLNLEGQVPLFTPARNRFAQLYPQSLGSLFVASYDSQGYGGGIWTRLHTGYAITYCLRAKMSRVVRRYRKPWLYSYIHNRLQSLKKWS